MKAFIKDFFVFLARVMRGGTEPIRKHPEPERGVNIESKPDQPKTQPPKQKKPQKYIYVIDAGHGGINPKGEYTTAPSKMFAHTSFTFYEGVFNRQIAERLYKMMNVEGLEYVKTYHDYEDTSLKARVKVANDLWSKRKCVFFSIHGNAAASPKATGIEFFTSPGQTMSDIIAEQLYKYTEVLIPELKLRIDIADGDKDKEALFYVLKNTKCPAVLSEFGFFTNPHEARLMMSADFQNRCAKVILETMKFVENS